MAYEHKIVAVSLMSTLPYVATQCDNESSDGWELVTCYENKSGGCIMLIFKRKITTKRSDKKSNSEYDFFLADFNKIVGKNFRGDSKSKGNFSARIKDGYSLNDLKIATENASRNEYLQANPQYLTPEYITRQNILEKWLNKDTQLTDEKTQKLDILNTESLEQTNKERLKRGLPLLKSL